MEQRATERYQSHHEAKFYIRNEVKKQTLKDANYSCGVCAKDHDTWETPVRHPRSGKSFPVRGFVTCSTENSIYL